MITTEVEIWRSKVEEVLKIAKSNKELINGLKDMDVKLKEIMSSVIYPLNSKNVETPLKHGSETLIIGDEIKTKPVYYKVSNKIAFSRTLELLRMHPTLMDYIHDKHKRNALKKLLKASKKYNTSYSELPSIKYSRKVEEVITKEDDKLPTYKLISSGWIVTAQKFNNVSTRDGYRVVFSMNGHWDGEYTIDVLNFRLTDLMVAQQHWGIFMRVMQKFNRQIKKLHKNNNTAFKKVQKAFKEELVAEEL